MAINPSNILAESRQENHSTAPQKAQLTMQGDTTQLASLKQSVDTTGHPVESALPLNLQPTSESPESPDQNPINQTNPPQQPAQQNQRPQPQLINATLPPIKPLLSSDVQTLESNIAGEAKETDQKSETMKQTSTPQRTIVTKVKLSDELNLFDWFRATDIINQIAEKARSSVDSVITTLDPGMKEYLYSGGNINVVVISDDEENVSSIRDSFQTVFGRATVTSDRQSSPSMAKTINQDYPTKLACGVNHALFVARDKIKKLRSDTSGVPQNQVILAIQPTLVQLQEKEPEKQSSEETNALGSCAIVIHNWFLTYCMMIEDPVLGATLHAYSHFIPVDTSIVASAKDAKSSDDRFNGEVGFSKSINELMTHLNLIDNGPNNSKEDWLRIWTGLKEKEVIRELSLVLAHAYRRKWNDCVSTT